MTAERVKHRASLAMMRETGTSHELGMEGNGSHDSEGGFEDLLGQLDAEAADEAEVEAYNRNLTKDRDEARIRGQRFAVDEDKFRDVVVHDNVRRRRVRAPVHPELDSRGIPHWEKLGPEVSKAFVRAAFSPFTYKAAKDAHGALEGSCQND